MEDALFKEKVIQNVKNENKEQRIENSWHVKVGFSGSKAGGKPSLQLQRATPDTGMCYIHLRTNTCTNK